MFEFAVIDSVGAEPALLYCSLGFKKKKKKKKKVERHEQT